MNLLVTGGAGFIGSNLIHHIIERPEITRLVNLDCLTYAGHLINLEKISSHPKYVFEKVDLRDKQAVWETLQRHAITHVMHLAAESHVDRSITGPGDFVHTNVVGTFNLLEGCRALWLQQPTGTARQSTRFHHISTDEVYGSLGAQGKFTESSPLDPTSPYAASKAASDLFVLSAVKTHGFPAIVTRCTNNYGPFQFPEKFVPLMIAQALAGLPLPVYGDGRNVRDWIHVQDHCLAIDLILRKGKEGEVYNIGGECELENITVARKILSALRQPETLLKFVTDRLAHDRRYALDCSKLKAALGWSPAWDFERGLQETIQWYQANTSWLEEVRSGEYQRYFERHYLRREETFAGKSPARLE